MDSQTNTPVAFATVKVLNKPAGVIASDKGEFDLNIDPADSVLISCVGYASKILTGKNIAAVIYLDKKIKTLKEVAVRERKWIRSVVLGNGVAYLDSNISCRVNSPEAFETAECHPWVGGNKSEFAEKIELPSNDLDYKIKKIIIPVSKGSRWGPVLLHLYYEDSGSDNPGEEFLLKQIDVKKEIVKKNKIYIDLSAENIYLTDSRSFFIGISWEKGEQEYHTRLSLIKSDKTTYTRVLLDNNYNWFKRGGFKFGNSETLIFTNTIYAAELDEMK
jgi:CarboxypepD_reg-like domain